MTDAMMSHASSGVFKMKFLISKTRKIIKAINVNEFLRRLPLRFLDIIHKGKPVDFYILLPTLKF